MRPNLVLSAFLLVAIAFSLFRILHAATPNPGHPWTGVGDGIWAATGTTALRTFTFPDADATILTSNTAVTVAQGGTGTTSLTGVIIGNGTSALTATTTLGSTSGGTGNAFTQITGPASSIKTFTLPNASATILTSNAAVTLAQGGTNASLTASNGGIFYSTGSAGAILSGTATAGQILRSGASTAPTWSTATYPATAGTTGNVLTSDGTNWVSSAPAGGGTTTRMLFTARTASLTADAKCHPMEGGCIAAGDRTTGTEMPFAGTIKNLEAFVTTVPSGGTCGFIVEKATGCGGAFSSTALSCTVAISGTTCTNTGTSVAIASGECIRMFFDEGASATCTGINSWSFEYQY